MLAEVTSGAFEWSGFAEGKEVPPE